MTTISLPAYAYEQDLPGLLDRLGAGDTADEIMVDFLPVTFWTPGALVSLLAKVHFWDKQNKRIGFQNYEECPAFRYLQRINFFSIFGLQMAENFRRHDAGSRFVELRRIGGEGSAGVAELSTDIAYCISPDADFEDPEQSGLFDLIEYSVSELASNVIQHARAPGFATAQYMPRTDLVRVGIADYGIGILRSFADNGSPLCKPDWTDADAIATALQPKVSSKSHLPSPWGEPVNAGVGLTLLKEICTQTGGHFFLASGQSAFSQIAGRRTPEQKPLASRFQGTICVLAFIRAKIRNFPELMHQVKTSVGLLPSGDKFGNLFS
jgi:hypothetical protein